MSLAIRFLRVFLQPSAPHQPRGRSDDDMPFMCTVRFGSPPLNYNENDMTGLIANGNKSDPEQIISSDPFFPSVSSKQIREYLRLDSSLTNLRLVPAIQAAVIEVNEQLESLTSKAASLGEISKKTITVDGITKPITEVLYFRAVSCATGAEVNERYRSYDTSNTGDQKAEKLTITIDDFRRDLRFAIRDLKKIRRLNVELV